MRIGLFSDTYLPDINGVVTSIETLRKGLIRQGHEVFIVANHSSLLDFKYEDNILLLPGIELKFLFGYNLSSPIQVNGMEIIKTMNLDVIHVHTEFGIGLFARTCARTLEIPLVYTYHTTYEDYTHYVNFFNSKVFDKVAKRAVATLSKMLSNPASILVTPSLKTKKMLEGYGINRPMHVIPTGIDLERFDETDLLKHQRQVLRHNYNIPLDGKVFIFVGRIAEEKNIQLVLNTFEHLVNTNDKLYFMIVGAGPDLDDINQWITQRGLNTHIITTGKVENTQIAAFYHCADAFVSASLSETQGLTYIEAMACGLPIFASDMSVLSDLLFESETGFFFDDEDMLAEKINHYLSLTDDTGLKLRAREVVNKYDSRIFADSILKVYTQAIDEYRHEYLVDSIHKLAQNYYQLNLISAGGVQQLCVVDEEKLNEFQIKEDRLLSQKELMELTRDDKFTQKYNTVLDRLTYRDMSVKQVEEYLESRFSGQEDNAHVTTILLEKGLIDDERLIQELITRFRQKGYGYYRIEKSLQEYKFEQDLLSSNLQQLNETQSEDLEKAFNKHLHLTKAGSPREGLNRLFSKLVRNGFDTSLVGEIVNAQNVNFDNLEVFTNCQKEFSRFMRRYTRQHNHDKAQEKTISSLLNKGYNYEMIMRVQEKVEDNE